MELISDPADMRAAALRRCARGSLGLVPTMGALHAGHLSLVNESGKRDSATVASIFVNPKQFGPNEDFDRYPRQLERDCELLREAGVDLVFVPAVEQMYPPGFTTRVQVEGMNARLCGGSRPGHFDGVATVVAKLLNIIPATRVYFGQKDAAQVALLRRMVRDLNLGTEIVVCPIVRDSDGLALSSRNAYLSRSERRSALALSQALSQVRERFEMGERDAQVLRTCANEVLRAGGIRVDYVEIVDADTLAPVETIGPHTLIAIAGFAGATRLIDNLVIDD